MHLCMHTLSNRAKFVNGYGALRTITMHNEKQICTFLGLKL